LQHDERCSRSLYSLVAGASLLQLARFNSLPHIDEPTFPSIYEVAGLCANDLGSRWNAARCVADHTDHWTSTGSVLMNNAKLWWTCLVIFLFPSLHPRQGQRVVAKANKRTSSMLMPLRQNFNSILNLGLSSLGSERPRFQKRFSSHTVCPLL
jgi:hypothetical protein